MDYQERVDEIIILRKLIKELQEENSKLKAQIEDFKTVQSKVLFIGHHEQGGEIV